MTTKNPKQLCLGLIIFMSMKETEEYSGFWKQLGCTLSVIIALVFFCVFLIILNMIFFKIELF